MYTWRVDSSLGKREDEQSHWPMWMACFLAEKGRVSDGIVIWKTKQCLQGCFPEERDLDMFEVKCERVSREEVVDKERRKNKGSRGLWRLSLIRWVEGREELIFVCNPSEPHSLKNWGQGSCCNGYAFPQGCSGV